MARSAPDGTPPALEHLHDELRRLEAADLLREPAERVAPLRYIILNSNDYLGYGRLPWPRAEGMDSGLGASRLVSGDDPAHTKAESVLAAWTGAGAALLFSSAYAANMSTLPALAGEGDLLISDALNHASIVDGCRLSRAEIRVFPHRDLVAVERILRESRARRRWVVTESYFSMDGDQADLRALRGLCDLHGAGLIVDEAHAIGVFGPGGAGLCAEAGIVADVMTGGFGKAVGLQGGFVAGPPVLRRWLWNRARGFVFSTGVSPALAHAAAMRIERLREDDAGRARLAAITGRLRGLLLELGNPLTSRSTGPILPWGAASPAEAVRLASLLRERGVIVSAIRPPTVPEGTARLRMVASTSFEADDLDRCLGVLREVLPRASR